MSNLVDVDTVGHEAVEAAGVVGITVVDGDSAKGEIRGVGVRGGRGAGNGDEGGGGRGGAPPRYSTSP